MDLLLRAQIAAERTCNIDVFEHDYLLIRRQGPGLFEPGDKILYLVFLLVLIGAVDIVNF